MIIKEDTRLNCTNCYYRNVCPGSILPTPASECERYIIDPKFKKDNVDESQKTKSDAGKPRLTLVPRRILTAIARIREYGNAKYPDGGPDNYKTVEVERYRDALFRHLVAYLDDPYGVDEESKLPHLWHLACNVAFLCELEDEEIQKGMKDACRN